MSDVRIPGKARNALREYAEENDLTYSEAVDDLLPEEELSVGSTVFIGISDDVHERLAEMAGAGVDQGEVILYSLLTETEHDPYTDE